MRGALRWLIGVALVLVFVPVFVLVFANIGPGRLLIENAVRWATGGEVRIVGLSGVIPTSPRLAHLELRDADGVWLTADDAALDWSPLRLLSREARVEAFTVGHVDVARMPVSSGSSGSGFSLPVRVVVGEARIDRLDLGAALAAHAVSVSVDGSATLDTLTSGAVRLAVAEIGGPGRYSLDAHGDPALLHAELYADEPVHGLVSGLAGLPDIGAISLHAKLDGPPDKAALDASLAAGPLRAVAGGTVDLAGMGGDLTVTADAPAMTPRADLSWQGITVRAHMTGAFAAPQVAGTVRVDGLAADGAALRLLSATISGDPGHVVVDGSAEGLRLPGPRPDLFASSPVAIKADARLDQAGRPVVFSLSHPLLAISGRAATADPIKVSAQLHVPALAPFAALGGVDLQGAADLAIDLAQDGAANQINADGTVSVTGGVAPVRGLIGPSAKLTASAVLDGADISVSRFEVAGKTIDLSATGGRTGDKIALDWKLALADLAVLAPQISGSIDATGQVQGTVEAFAVSSELSGTIATAGVPAAPIKATLRAENLPGAPTGRISAEGALDGAPLSLDLSADRAADGTLNTTITRAEWKSAHAEGALSLAPGAILPQGHMEARITRLADLDRLLGTAIAGSVEAKLDADASAATLQLDASGAGFGAAARAERARLTAKVTDPAGAPVLAAKLAIDGLRGGGVGANLTVDATGPALTPTVRAAVTLPDLGGAPATVTGAGQIDVAGSSASVSALQAASRGETLRLLAPMRVSWREGVTLDRLRLGLRRAVLDVAGRVSPTLDLTAALTGVSGDMLGIVAPGMAADGSLQAQARLTGSPARPDGTVSVTATGVHVRSGPGAAIPPANLTANATLAGGSARVDARLNAGKSIRLTLAGQAPLDPAGRLDLRLGGLVDLAVTDPFLTPTGRRARGQVTPDIGIAGTLAAPVMTGSMQLAQGEVQDVPLGARITAIAAQLQADGQSIRIASFTGKAGTGTVSAAGAVGVLAPGMPVDLTVTARDATPLASDRLTARLDADLTLKGQVQGALTAGGTLDVKRADIRIPEKLPPDVAVLNVRIPGQKPPPPAAPLDLALDLTINAPQQVFVRGRGLDAELGGKLILRGPLATLRPQGGFDLRRGVFSLTGFSLNFTQGRVAFDGAGGFDPSLNFVASTTNGNTTANLNILGYASAPKITLTSTPELPQDEILAQLLFGQSAVTLSTFQLAQIAAALAQVSGAAGDFDPLGAVRKGLGLDRLSVGGGTNGSAPSIEAGRYVAPGVYVGAKQGVTGTDTQATVQIDLLKGLKLQADVGTGSTSATGDAARTGSGGSGVGLTYQFEY